MFRNLAWFSLLIGMAYCHPDLTSLFGPEMEKLVKEYQEMMLEIEPLADVEDTYLTVPELVTKYGYPFEQYWITTYDGYILNMHRIPHGKNGQSNGYAVFVMHGLLCSSADWVVAGPEMGLAYMLADQGYDVWLGNARGNTYSRNHTIYNPDNEGKDFWGFTWHEIGFIDLPAMIDFALATSGQEKIFHIGHSQGTTTFYIMTSLLPEYNQKIRAHFSMAPIAYMNHMKSPILQIISVFEKQVTTLIDFLGIYEFLPATGFIATHAPTWCADGVSQIFCVNILFLVCGFDKENMNKTLLPIIMGHTPAGSSAGQMLHYSQEIKSGNFREWDYGRSGNNDHYNNNNPPDYPLSKVTAPVYLYYSHNDWLAAEIDVERLYSDLPNCLGKFFVSNDKWNHLDYMWGNNVDTLVYYKIFSLMKHHYD